MSPNRRFAELLGWTNIIEVAGALLGTPPAGQPECRGQARVPDWTGDWRACGPLQDEYKIFLHYFPRGVVATAKGAEGAYASHADHVTGDVATRHAVVVAIIYALQGRAE